MVRQILIILKKKSKLVLNNCKFFFCLRIIIFTLNGLDKGLTIVTCFEAKPKISFRLIREILVQKKKYYLIY